MDQAQLFQAMDSTINSDGEFTFNSCMGEHFATFFLLIWADILQRFLLKWADTLQRRISGGHFATIFDETGGHFDTNFENF